MKTQRRKFDRLWVYLLYLGLVTSLILSVTLAKYASTATGTGTATVAAMAGGDGKAESKPIQMLLSDLYPGQSKSLKFEVVNYNVDTVNGNRVSEVAMDYTIKVETTGNLPLTFTLSKVTEETSATGSTVVDKAESGKLDLAPDQMGTPLEGGFFPLEIDPATNKLMKQEHVYTLTAIWPAEESNIDYVDEIDLVTVTVEASQRLAVAEPSDP